MQTLVIVEHDNLHMVSTMRNVLCGALQLQHKIIFLVLGFNCEAVALEAAALKGVDEVWVIDKPCYEHLLAEQIAATTMLFAESFDFIIAPASTFGKNCLPRIAALLDVAQVSDVSRILTNDLFEHPIYAGNALETVRLLDAKKVLTIRPTSFDAITATQAPCRITPVDAQIEAPRTSFVKHVLSQSKRPDLAAAKIVVSGGRGLQTAENFKLIESLADALGGAVGASRAAVDAGYVPNDFQVGQTGKVVAPQLYIAVGISGAIQHIAGMKDSKIIVAINKDEDAPIFQIATYGLVGDLFEIIPQLINALQTPD